MIVIRRSQVTKHTSKTIYYTDSDGKEQVIDLQAIFKTQLAEKLRPENLERIRQAFARDRRDLPPSLEDYVIEVANQWREVGMFNRKPKDGLPYIDFYTNPITRIEFTSQESMSAMTSRLMGHKWNLWDYER